MEVLPTTRELYLVSLVIPCGLAEITTFECLIRDLNQTGTALTPFKLVSGRDSNPRPSNS